MAIGSERPYIVKFTHYGRLLEHIFQSAPTRVPYGMEITEEDPPEMEGMVEDQRHEAENRWVIMQERSRVDAENQWLTMQAENLTRTENSELIMQLQNGQIMNESNDAEDYQTQEVYDAGEYQTQEQEGSSPVHYRLVDCPLSPGPYPNFTPGSPGRSSSEESDMDEDAFLDLDIEDESSESEEDEENEASWIDMNEGNESCEVDEGAFAPNVPITIEFLYDDDPTSYANEESEALWVSAPNSPNGSNSGEEDIHMDGDTFAPDVPMTIQPMYDPFSQDNIVPGSVADQLRRANEMFVSTLDVPVNIPIDHVMYDPTHQDESVIMRGSVAHQLRMANETFILWGRVWPNDIVPGSVADHIRMYHGMLG